MKRAMVRKDLNRLFEVRPLGEEFEVAHPMEWVDCDDAVRPETHDYDGQDFALKPPPPAKPPRIVQDEVENTDAKADNTIMSLVDQTKVEWISWASSNFPSLTAAERTRLGTLFWIVSIAVRRCLRSGA